MIISANKRRKREKEKKEKETITHYFANIHLVRYQN